MKPETNNKLKKIQLFVAISLLLVSSLLLFKDSGITGHFSADFRSQILDMKIEESQSYSITSDNSEPIFISSLRLSGVIKGYGNVEIYIEDENERFLIYKNIQQKEQGLIEITGMVIVQAQENIQEEAISLFIEPLETIRWDGRTNLADNEEFAMGPFSNKCVDTCFMEMPLSTEDRYKLIFMIEPGTIVEINKITYTLKDDII